MAIQQDLSKAVSINKEIPIDVIPDYGKAQSGQELYGRGNAAKGVYQYNNGPSTYLNVAPGTKTKAKLVQEAAERIKATVPEAVPLTANPAGNIIQGKATGANSPNNSDVGLFKNQTKNSQLDQWLLQALEITGQDASLLPYLKTIAMKESGGNPKAINDWDINAKRGTPSKGLLQTIDSTFNAYKVKGHEDIWNPVDNAVAAIRYSISRYGSLQNVPGIKAMASGKKYVGY